MNGKNAEQKHARAAKEARQKRQERQINRALGEGVLIHGYGFHAIRATVTSTSYHMDVNSATLQLVSKRCTCHRLVLPTLPPHSIVLLVPSLILLSPDSLPPTCVLPSLLCLRGEGALPRCACLLPIRILFLSLSLSLFSSALLSSKSRNVCLRRARRRAR